MSKFMKVFINQVLVVLFCLAASARAAGPALIPAPQEMKVQDGVFVLNSKTEILEDTTAKPAAAFLAEHLRHGTGFGFPVKSSRKAAAGNILLTTKGSN